MSLLLSQQSVSFTGTAALVESPATLSGVGSLAFTGTAALTESPATVSATGLLVFSGTAALTESPATLSATGSLQFIGTAALSQSPQTLSATGKLEFTGTSSLTQTPQAISASGKLEFSATAAVTESPATLSASGKLEFTGTASPSQSPASLNASAVLEFRGTAAPTQSPETLSAIGTVVPPIIGPPPDIFGTFAGTASPATLSADGTVENPAPPEGPPTSQGGRGAGRHLRRVPYELILPRALPASISGRAGLTAQPAQMQAQGAVVLPARKEEPKRAKPKGSVRIQRPKAAPSNKAPEPVPIPAITGSAAMTGKATTLQGTGKMVDQVLENALLALMLDAEQQ